MEYFDVYDELFERLKSTGLSEEETIVLVAQVLTIYEQDIKLIEDN